MSRAGKDGQQLDNAPYVIYDDGRIEDFTIEMAPFVVVLGDVSISEMQAMWDRIAGGPVGICLSRAQEVA
jgi:hypothetical protein